MLSTFYIGEPSDDSAHDEIWSTLWWSCRPKLCGPRDRTRSSRSFNGPKPTRPAAQAWSESPALPNASRWKYPSLLQELAGLQPWYPVPPGPRILRHRTPQWQSPVLARGITHGALSMGGASSQHDSYSTTSRHSICHTRKWSHPARASSQRDSTTSRQFIYYATTWSHPARASSQHDLYSTTSRQSIYHATSWSHPARAYNFTRPVFIRSSTNCTMRRRFQLARCWRRLGLLCQSQLSNYIAR